MRIFALELNNDIKGIAQRKEYIEFLIAGLPSPDFVVLPELALCSYMASQEIWQCDSHTLILFLHGCSADPKKPEAEQRANDFFCGAYETAFQVPVVYVNSKGRLEHMPGKMGQMMEKAGFTMNGYSKIYYPNGTDVACGVAEAVGADIAISPQKRQSDIHFHGDDITRGNWFFRQFILKPDTKAGVKAYEGINNDQVIAKLYFSRHPLYNINKSTQARLRYIVARNGPKLESTSLSTGGVIVPAYNIVYIAQLNF